MAARCPDCGRGPLFDGVLRFADRCAACGADFAAVEDTGDGPAVFVIFIVGILVVPIPVLLAVGGVLPTWLSLTIFLPLIVLVSVWLLRVMRAGLFRQAWARQARETRFRSR